MHNFVVSFLAIALSLSALSNLYEKQAWSQLEVKTARVNGGFTESNQQEILPNPSSSLQSIGTLIGGDRPDLPLEARSYSGTELEYFMKIALGSEYGDAGGRIHKWDAAQGVRIWVTGMPTERDRQTLTAVMTELQAITGMAIALADRPDSSNITLHFGPDGEFSQVLSTYVPGNKGFFWTWWDQDRITRATILISTEGITQGERSHLIREELTQSLGLMQDTWDDANSIFYQGWTATEQFSTLDRAVIQLLYDPAIAPGMTAEQVRQSLELR